MLPRHTSTAHSRRAVLVAAMSITGVAGLSACSSGADSRSPDKEKVTSSKPPTPMDRLKAAKKKMDATDGMHLELSSKGVPETASGVTKGSGDGGPRPEFKGNLTARVAQVEADVPIVAIEDKVWAKLPIWPEMRRMNPEEYGAPNPAVLFSRDKGISSLLPKTKKAKFGAERRDGGDVVRVITGELAGQDVFGVLALGNPSLTYDVTYLITEGDELRSAAVRGVFFNDATTTYTLRLDDYGKKIDVKPPA